MLKVWRVIWWDSCRTFEERCKSDLESCITLETVGFLVSEDEREIVLAQDINKNNEPETYRGSIAILKDNIVESKEMMNAPPVPGED